MQVSTHAEAVNMPSPSNQELLASQLSNACRNYDAAQKAMPDDERARYLESLRDTCMGTNESKRDDFAALLISEMRGHPSAGAMDKIMCDAILGADLYDYRPNKETILSEELLVRFGLETKRSARALKLWETGYEQGRLPNNDPNPACMSKDEYFLRCAQRTLDIERQRPGGVKLLARRYDIRNIGRVPEDWLLDLIDHGHKKYARLILAGISSACNNSAMMRTTERLNQARKNLPDDTFMVPIEMARPGQIKKRLEFLERAINISKHKPKVIGVIAAGHGNHDGTGARDYMKLREIRGTRGISTEKLAASDVAGPLGDILVRLLTPDAHGLLLSCDMGKASDGLAATACDYIKRDVVSLREPAGLQDIQITVDGNAARFIPELVHRTAASPTEWQYHESQPKHFTPSAAPIPIRRTANAPGLASAA